MLGLPSLPKNYELEKRRQLRLAEQSILSIETRIDEEYVKLMARREQEGKDSPHYSDILYGQILLFLLLNASQQLQKLLHNMPQNKAALQGIIKLISAFEQIANIHSLDKGEFIIITTQAAKQSLDPGASCKDRLQAWQTKIQDFLALKRQYEETSNQG